jgi:high affinity Mn2+ porin
MIAFANLGTSFDPPVEPQFKPKFEPKFEQWDLKGQFTNLGQYHKKFKSIYPTYPGSNSLKPDGQWESSNALTGFGALRLWQGAGLYLNPEIVQGFGLNNARGLAGFPISQSYKQGETAAYFRMQRLFVYQNINLSGTSHPLPSGINQLSDMQSENHIALTLGKFAVTDVFDTNLYANNPKTDFLNASVIHSGAFDYAQDAWGYTYGASAELYYGGQVFRTGLFALSKAPHALNADPTFNQYAWVGEFEMPYQTYPTYHNGALKLLGFLNHGKMSGYREARQLGAATGKIPDLSLSRQSHTRGGIVLNIAQPITASVGLFARASVSDSQQEVYEYTDIHRSIATGLSLQGRLWGRAKDTFGLSVAANSIGRDARRYFAAGGMGLLIGDGYLRRSGLEQIVEAYYGMQFLEYFTVSADYQYIRNPAYNRDRGPVSIFSLRTHAQF